MKEQSVSKSNSSKNTVNNINKDKNSWSRRDFVKAGSAALVGLALSPRPAFAADTSPRKVRIGVVGGGFGTDFQWHEHPYCIVEAVSDLIPERRNRIYILP